MISLDQERELLATLQTRFQSHPWRHELVEWDSVLQRLKGSRDKLRSLQAMEASGGEPDVVGTDSSNGALLFVDCSPETPAGRRSLCFDRRSWESRKKNRPEGNVEEAVSAMGVSLLDEEQYFHLQSLGEFDQKTSSWLATPSDIRELGGALFGDRRFGRTFIYHNGAESYYAARGFRTLLRV